MSSGRALDLVGVIFPHDRDFGVNPEQTVRRGSRNAPRDRLGLARHNDLERDALNHAGGARRPFAAVGPARHRRRRLDRVAIPRTGKAMFIPLAGDAVPRSGSATLLVCCELLRSALAVWRASQLPA